MTTVGILSMNVVIFSFSTQVVLLTDKETSMRWIALLIALLLTFLAGCRNYQVTTSAFIERALPEGKATAKIEATFK